MVAQATCCNTLVAKAHLLLAQLLPTLIRVKQNLMQCAQPQWVAQYNLERVK